MLTIVFLRCHLKKSYPVDRGKLLYYILIEEWSIYVSCDFKSELENSAIFLLFFTSVSSVLYIFIFYLINYCISFFCNKPFELSSVDNLDPNEKAQ